MKKIFTLTALVASMFIMTSCGGGGGASTPGEAAVSYMECIQNGDYEAYVEGLYRSPEQKADADKLKKGDAQLVTMLEAKGNEKLDEKDGIKEIVLISETMSEDGKSADVKLNLIYGNGEEDEEPIKMVLDENGEWKMKKKK